MTPPAIVRGQPNSAYHLGAGLSCTGIKRLRRTPRHFRGNGKPAPQDEPTPALLNGILTHCALLEPDAFDSRYAVVPEMRRSGKAWQAAVQAHAGRELITSQQRAAAFAQAQALRELPELQTLMADGEPEVSAYWVDEETGVLCKCRPDWVGYVGYGRGCVLVDVKTTSDASRWAFRRSVERYGYHLQADWYCTGYAIASGLEVHGMVFAAVESEPPHAAAVYMLSDRALTQARKDNREALALYAQCAAANSWPGYPSGIQVIDLPPWGYE